MNLILDTDSYKASHFLQYPPGTTGMYSYFESRGGRYDRTVFFGLQYYLQRYLTTRITPALVEEAEAFFHAHGEPFHREGWMRVAVELGGRLPVRIRAVPEGSVVPTLNVLMDVESTDPETFWMVSWLETLLVRVWYPITVATQSYFLRELIGDYLRRTADESEAELGFKLHDFGSRGVSSQESAMIGGAAHLVNFMGSDTVAGVVCANEYYRHPMAAFSIPAAEHSTITAWGRARELDAYRNMLRQFARPGAYLACVSDSYDLWNVIDQVWGGALKEEVIRSGATVVIRPDSGDPPTVVLEVLRRLAAAYGVTHNRRGYQVLNHVRVIQGDGINPESLDTILRTITEAGFSASNVAFGMGGALLQQINRDTQKFAYKCSEVTIAGARIPVHKFPVTDPDKASKAGRLDLVRRDGRYQTVSAPADDSELVVVYENGELLRTWTLEEVRARAHASHR